MLFLFKKKKETKIEKVEFLLLLTHVCNNMYLFIYVFIFGQIFKLSSQKSELVNLTYPKVWLVEKKNTFRICDVCLFSQYLTNKITLLIY